MYWKPLPVILTGLLLTTSACFAQGVIGGNQNGLGPDGYLPQPTPISPASAAPVVTTLGMPGYDFKVLVLSGKPTEVYVDPQYPIMVPLLTTLPPPKTPVAKKLGFWASFEVVNNSAFKRDFHFVDAYYANLKIVFSMLNDKGVVVWQSYKTEVDIPPLAKKINLALPPHDKWSKRVFVPLVQADQSPLKPGSYTLQAEVIGTPGYEASAPFTVSTLSGGPIVLPLNPVKTLK